MRSMRDLRWEFWMPFDERFGGNGGVGVSVTAEDGSLQTATDNANRRVLELLRLTEGNPDTMGIYFASDYPFDSRHLAEIECSLDNEGVVRLAGETDDDFMERVNLFLELHGEEED